MKGHSTGEVIRLRSASLELAKFSTSTADGQSQRLIARRYRVSRSEGSLLQVCRAVQAVALDTVFAARGKTLQKPSPREFESAFLTETRRCAPSRRSDAEIRRTFSPASHQFASSTYNKRGQYARCARRTATPPGGGASSAAANR